MVPSFDDSIDASAHVQRRKLLLSLLQDDTPDVSLMGKDARRTDAWFTSEGDTTLSEQVIQAVAEAKQLDPATLPSIYGVLDPDALNELFRDDDAGFMELGYAGCSVTVCSDGRIIVRSAETSAR